MSETVRLAAIDIGTVTTRLLVADVDDEGISEVERSTDITHLGQGIGDTGSLSADAMRRVADVMAGYAETMERLGVERHVALATSASRDASNADEFVAMLAAAGVRPEVIPGSREAELSFLGATSQRVGDGLLVVDCGGGSTELVLGDVVVADGARVARIEAARSIDVGSRRLTDAFLAGDPPSRGELDAARTHLVGELRPYFDRLEQRPREMLALAGTATTIAAIRLELAEYDSAAVHGLKISGSELAEILAMLASMSLERRLRVVGLHPQRAGVIVAGALILETILALAGLDSMTVSEHDILYGILLDTYRDLRKSGGDAG